MAFTNTPILKHFDLQKRIILQFNGFGLAITTSSISTMNSRFFSQSISTLETAPMRIRTTTRMIRNFSSLLEQRSDGDTLLRARSTRSLSSRTIRIVSTSKPPKCFPEDRQVGWKFYTLTTLTPNALQARTI